MSRGDVMTTLGAGAGSASSAARSIVRSALCVVAAVPTVGALPIPALTRVPVSTPTAAAPAGDSGPLIHPGDGQQIRCRCGAHLSSILPVT